VSEIGLVTVNCPLASRGAGRLVVHIADARFVVDCNVTSVKLAGQDKTIAPPDTVAISSSGGMERLNTVPRPEAPPFLCCPIKGVSR
jgi:hypothetical protein